MTIRIGHYLPGAQMTPVDTARLSNLVERLERVQADWAAALASGSDDVSDLQITRWKLCGEIEDEVRTFVQGFQPPNLPGDNRPALCRQRLQDEGKPYPRSGCQACNSTAASGLMCRYRFPKAGAA